LGVYILSTKEDFEKIPGWVLVQRKKGTEIHRRGDNFYLCKVSRVWDKKLKISRKITGEYLGKITKEGIVPLKQKQLLAAFKHVAVKEYGASSYLRAIAADIEESESLPAIPCLRCTEERDLSVVHVSYPCCSPSLPD